MKISKKIALLFFILFLSRFFLKSESYLSLREILDSQAGNKNIIIPKNKYLLDVSSGPYIFSGLKDVTIDGNGSEIICNKQSRAFTFNFCENVRFQNFSIDYQPLCFTQGRIISISPDKMLWDIKVFKGYPIKNISNRKLQLFDPNTLELKKNYHTIYESNFSITQIGSSSDSTYRITKKRALSPTLESVGDIVVLNVTAEGNSLPHTIYLNSCKNLNFENIIIYGSNSFSFFESECENNSYHYCKILRKEDDPEVGFPRLRSGNADGIHSKHATIGPTITNCRIEYNGDDCIAISGFFYPVYKVDESKKLLYVLNKETNAKLYVNDSLVIVGNDGCIKGFRKCEKITKETPSADEIQVCLSKFKKGVQDADSYTKGVQLKLTNGISDIEIGDLIYSKNRVGNSFIVENDTVGFTRARGMMIKASDGKIKNNIVANCELAGIVLAPEFSWMGAGCSRNVEISYNEIKNCLFTASGGSIPQPGALSVISINGNGEISECATFSDISIHDNLIQGCPNPSVVLTSISNCNFYNNTIIPDINLNRQHGSNYGVSNNNEIWTKNVSEFDLSSTSPTNLMKVKLLINDTFLVIKKENEYSPSPLKLHLYNSSGMMIWNSLLFDEISLPLTNLPRGVYALSVNEEKSQFTQQIKMIL
jgi:hypothetical protein